ncbi:hypothetical protein [Acidiphilium acidophilum]|jgi:hypothetical protein|uniref:Uncharacterized protein n=1 Tax=Acidiphilium acidophilum TaxID=76588 RepID=A0AAW9DVG7_ACIAO|nr:hypothetical protein [Acidiphilium acidophilum]MDX5932582.1 hypothetical protein [Acidiphilium acidophilum]MEE3500313.1 hypothetical protein [Acidiphilium acidophilum]GBQ19560.1 hypothetical protein AA700_1335 [Acidiphilium acidophilum DSM 700]
MHTLPRGAKIGIVLITLFAGGFVALAVYGAYHGDTARGARISAVSSQEMSGANPGGS